MRTSVLLITTLVGAWQHVGVFFLPSSSNGAVGTCPRRAKTVRGRSTCAFGNGSPRRDWKSTGAFWFLAPRKPAAAESFQGAGRKSAKWWISARRRRHGCPKKRPLGAQKEPALSPPPPVSSFAARLAGTIGSINAPAVINTVLRQPTAWKRLGGRGRGEGERGRLRLWLSSLPTPFQLPFCASHNT